MLEGVDALEICLGKFMERGRRCGSQSEDLERLFFLDATMNGVKVDTNTTHSFISEQTTMRLYCKPTSSLTTFMVVNSTMKPTVGVVHSTPLRDGDWFGSFNFMVASLDDHAMVLG
jgi:hypothetical protein